MYVVTVRDSFSAAHRLSGAGGKCEELHGHNYSVEVSVEGRDLSEEGILIDFRELKKVLKEVISDLDHRYLNEIDFFKANSSSSEHIAFYVFQRVKEHLQGKGVNLREVRIWESESSCASYREDR